LPEAVERDNAAHFGVDRPRGACYHRIIATGRTRRSIAMADLKAEFEQAAKAVMDLKERPDNDVLLKLYALYKQGSEGDVSGPKPGFFDFVGSAKYEAWEKLKGTKAEDAMKKYIATVKSLMK
jgi:acyl-CoA-binding protein